MDYDKKKVEEAFALLKELYPIMNDYTKEKIAGIIPEIKESEDERIRKALIVFICEFAPEHLKAEFVSYLEKQKEQIPSPEDAARNEGFCEGTKATKDDFWDRGLECMVEKDIITGMKTIRAHGLRDALKREDIMSQLNIGDHIRLVFMKGGEVINE